MLTLYEFGNSVCCQKVRVTLAEKGVAWTSRQVDLFANQQFDPAYLKLNPAGVVPTLVRGDEVVTESTLICEYLDQIYPDPPLMPDTAIGKALARRWPKLADEGLHEGIGAISFAAMFRERMRAMTPEQREARYNNIGDPKRGDLFRQTLEHGAKAKQVGYAVAAYERMFKRLEATLGEGGPWIMGSQPTLADIALMPYVARLNFLGLLDLWIGHRPNVTAWWALVQLWPSFRTGIVEPMIPHELDEMREHGPPIRSDITELLEQLRRV